MKYLNFDMLGGIAALDSEGAQFAMDVHVHDEFVIAAYYRGQKRYSCRNDVGLLGRGDALIISPNVAHSACSVDNGCRYLALYPSWNQLAEATGVSEAMLVKRMGDSREIPAHQGGVAIGEMLAQIFLEPVSLVPFSLQTFFCELLTHCSQDDAPSTVASPSLSRIWEKIYEEPLADANLSDLAEYAGLSKEHLCRSFKTAYGISPFQLLRARRTALARHLISHGCALSSAAMMAGFADQSHMCRWFQRLYGAPPGDVAQHQ